MSTTDPTTPEGRVELRRIATDGWTIHPEQALALLDALDAAECEAERLRGDVAIERRRVDAAETALTESVKLRREQVDLVKGVAEWEHNTSVARKARAERAEAALARVREAVESLRNVITTSSLDWGSASDIAWIYGIVVGWDTDPRDDDGLDAMRELTVRFSWTTETVERLRRLSDGLRTAMKGDRS